MRKHLLAIILSGAVAMTGSLVSAQTGSGSNSMGGSTPATGDKQAGQSINSENTPGSTGTTGSSSGTAGSSSSTDLKSGSSVGSSSLNSSSSSLNATPGRMSASSQTQVEGRLVDIFSASEGSSALSGSSSSGLSSSGLSSSSTNHLSSTAGSSGSTASSATTPLTTGSVTPTGETSGTYSRPGAAVGSGGATSNIANAPSVGNSNISKQGGIPNGVLSRDLNSSTGGSVSSASSGSASGSQLTAGIPAAIVANGKTYVLACDPRQLAMYAGQTVRVSGRVSQNVIVPDKIESRQGGGDFREISFTKPIDADHVRTAGER